MLGGFGSLLLPPLMTSNLYAAAASHGHCFQHSSIQHSPSPPGGPSPCAVTPPLRPTDSIHALLNSYSAQQSPAKNPMMTMPPISATASNDHSVVTLFPRRKAGQTRPGGGRGPVVLNLEMLEQFYGVPLHVAAKKLGICQTAIKKVCRRLGIKKWPYKEMRIPTKDEQDLEAVFNKYNDCSSTVSSPTDVSAPVEDCIEKAKREPDDDVHDAVRALLILQSDCSTVHKTENYA